MQKEIRNSYPGPTYYRENIYMHLPHRTLRNSLRKARQLSLIIQNFKKETNTHNKYHGNCVLYRLKLIRVTCFTTTAAFPKASFISAFAVIVETLGLTSSDQYL